MAVTRFATADVVITTATAVGCFALWSAHDAGYEEILWYPVGLLFLLLGAVLAWSAPERELSRASALAVGGFAAFAAWAYLSILWAGDRGLALTGADRALVYLVVLVVVLRRRWHGLDALTALVLWSLVTVIAGLVVLLRASDTSSPFLFGRFSSPVEYANANAALFVVAAWPCLAASMERRLPWAARAAALGAATVAVELALLGQSKGAALGVAATLVLVTVVARERARFLLSVLVVAAVVAVFHGPLLDVFSRLNDGAGARHEARHAAATMGASFFLAAALGALVAVAGEAAARRAPARARVAGAVLVGAAAVATVASLAAVAAHYGGPGETLRRAWHAFAHPPTGSDSSSHFTSATGNNRYDYWRVAAHQLRHHPVGGAGMDNFGADYVRERRSQQEPAYPHSLEARLLGGTGLVGFALFFVFLGAAAWVAVGAARSRGAPAGIAALAMLSYWFAHGSVDWLWEFPGITAPVLFAVAASAAAPDGEQSRDRRRRERVVRTAAPVAAVVAAVLLVPAWVAARDVASALSTWRADPGGADAKLRQAASLNRLADQPYIVSGTIAERRRSWAAAEDAFTKAVSRNGGNWYSHFELGIALAERGARPAALRELRRAHALDPRDTLVAETLANVRAGRPVRPGLLDREFIARTPVGAAG